MAFSGTSFSGGSDGTGVYLLETVMASLSNCSFSGLGKNVLEEDF